MNDFVGAQESFRKAADAVVAEGEPPDHTDGEALSSALSIHCLQWVPLGCLAANQVSCLSVTIVPGRHDHYQMFISSSMYYCKPAL